MSISKKNFDFSKYGLANFQKKIGVNFLRYVFSAVNKENSTEERQYYIEHFTNRSSCIVDWWCWICDW